MANLYSQLVKETIQFLQEQPQNHFELVSPTLHAFFPKTKALPPAPVKAPLLPKPQLPAAEKKPAFVKPIEEPIHVQASVPQVRPAAPPAIPSSEIQKTLQKIAPHMRLSNEVPGDAVAQRIASSWQEKMPDTEVVLLLLDPSKESVEFLKNLGKAVHTQLCPAKVISGTRLEQEKRWDLFLEKNAFRLIIATDGMKNYPDLMRYYKALPAQQESFLGKTPFISLSPTATYLTSPEHKAILWKKLCQILKTQ
jgi:hypothetical protein